MGIFDDEDNRQEPPEIKEQTLNTLYRMFNYFPALAHEIMTHRINDVRDNCLYIIVDTRKEDNSLTIVQMTKFIKPRYLKDKLIARYIILTEQYLSVGYLDFNEGNPYPLLYKGKMVICNYNFTIIPVGKMLKQQGRIFYQISDEAKKIFSLENEKRNN